MSPREPTTRGSASELPVSEFARAAYRNSLVPCPGRVEPDDPALRWVVTIGDDDEWCIQTLLVREGPVEEVCERHYDQGWSVETMLLEEGSWDVWIDSVDSLFLTREEAEAELAWIRLVRG